MRILISEKLSPHKFKTPEGYLICQDSVLARTGKQEYQKRDLFGDSCDDADDVVEVDRPEEEVFSDKTLASFENKPVTIEHPDEDVTVENHNSLAVGFVRDIKRGIDNGQPVMIGTLVITDQEAIDDIENGTYKELSCGYDCDIDDSQGYSQKNIRGNHVALCEHGRAGNARIIDSKIEDKSNKDVHPNELNAGDIIIYHGTEYKVLTILKYLGGYTLECESLTTHSKWTFHMGANAIINQVNDSMKDEDSYKIIAVKGHVEVYKNGEFWETADSKSEAEQDIEDDKKATHDEESTYSRVTKKLEKGEKDFMKDSRYNRTFFSLQKAKEFGESLNRQYKIALDNDAFNQRVYVVLWDSVKDADKPEFAARGKWEWDEVKQDWYDTGRKMYYTEIVRVSGKKDSIKDADLDLSKAIILRKKEYFDKDENRKHTMTLLKVPSDDHWLWWTIRDYNGEKIWTKGATGDVSERLANKTFEAYIHMAEVGRDRYLKGDSLKDSKLTVGKAVDAIKSIKDCKKPKRNNRR